MHHSITRAGRLLVVLVCAALVDVASAHAYSARLTWAPVTGATGYKVYTRAQGQTYGAGTDIGAPAPAGDGLLHHDVAGLQVDTTYYFAISTYDARGTESPRSNELFVGYTSAATVVDSDADGLTDAREDVNLNRVTDAGETDRLRADTDGDGVSDGAERAAGTDPLNSASRPPTPTASATPSATPTRTPTPPPTATRTSTPHPTATPTPARTSTPSPSATRTSAPTPSATRTVSATPTPTATATATRTVTPTATPARTPNGALPPPPPVILGLDPAGN